MSRIVWVDCPKCNYEFYCDDKAFRDLKHKLLCPQCGHEFLFNETSVDKKNND